MKDPKTPWWFGPFGCFSMLLGLAFWATVIYVAVHFIAKWW